MATTAVIEHTNSPDDADLKALVVEHRYWLARLREAIERGRHLRNHAAGVRQYCRNISRGWTAES
jgi:hypothetical protein